MEFSGRVSENIIFEKDVSVVENKTISRLNIPLVYSFDDTKLVKNIRLGGLLKTVSTKVQVEKNRKAEFESRIDLFKSKLFVQTVEYIQTATGAVNTRMLKIYDFDTVNNEVFNHNTFKTVNLGPVQSLIQPLDLAFDDTVFRALVINGDNELELRKYSISTGDEVYNSSVKIEDDYGVKVPNLIQAPIDNFVLLVGKEFCKMVSKLNGVSYKTQDKMDDIVIVGFKKQLLGCLQLLLS